MWVLNQVTVDDYVHYDETTARVYKNQTVMDVISYGETMKLTLKHVKCWRDGYEENWNYAAVLWTILREGSYFSKTSLYRKFY